MRISLEKISRLPRIRWWAVVIAVLWIAVFSGGLLLHALGRPEIPLCALKLVAGLPCPVCGSLRAGEALLRLDIAGAIRSNPLIFILGVLGAAYLVLRLGFGRVLKIGLSRTGRIAAAAVAILAVAADWAFLILDGR